MDAFGKTFCIGYKKIITNKLDLLSKSIRQFLPSIPVFFTKTIFDGNNRIFVNQLFIKFNHAFRSLCGMVPGQMVQTIITKEFRSCHISSKYHIFPCGISCFFNSFTDDFHSCLIGWKIRRITTFITYSGRKAFTFQYVFQGMIDFCTHTESFVETWCPNRHNHAFLNVNIIICMSTAVHDIHHGYRQIMCINTTKILIKGKSC